MSQTNPQKASLSIKEAARPLFGMSEWAVYDAIRRGTIPKGVYFRVGTRIRINSKAANEWMLAGGSDEGQAA